MCFYYDEEQYIRLMRKKKHTFICIHHLTKSPGKKKRIALYPFQFNALNNKHINKHDGDKMLRTMVMITMNRTGMILKMLYFQNKNSQGTLILLPLNQERCMKSLIDRLKYQYYYLTILIKMICHKKIM